jgi:hypothetical protein
MGEPFPARVAQAMRPIMKPTTIGPWRVASCSLEAMHGRQVGRSSAALFTRPTDAKSLKPTIADRPSSTDTQAIGGDRWRSVAIGGDRRHEIDRLLLASY